MLGTFAPWTEFALAFLAFLALHLLPARPRLRAILCGLAGERAYVAVYSAVSLLLLGWLIAAAGREPFVEVWAFAPWQMWVPNIAMPAACLLAAFGIGASNPFSFGGYNAQAFDPERPDIAGISRHPLLLALVLWAASHAVPNGDLAHVFLFGTFAVVRLMGTLALDKRARGRIGPAEWQRLALAVLLNAGLLLLHQPLIGVSPRPVL